MIDIAYRHVPSICLVIAAFIHRNNQQYQQVNDPMQHQIACFFAPLLGGVWYFAGTYLFRRWHITMAASLIPALIWTFPKNQNICSIFSQWSFYDWFACTLMITSATLMLDYFDAILNMYPYLVTSSAKQREAIQDPARAPYWLALGELMLSLSSERELNPLPIRDMQEAIKKLGHSGRSWKTMSILFPSNLRQEMCMLYAWFRLCDDLVDDAEEYKQGRFALNLIRTFLDESFNGPDNDLKTCTSESGRLAMQDPSLPFLDWDYLDDHLTSDRLAVFRCFARQAFMLCPKAANALTEAWAIDLKKKPLKTEENVKNYASLISGRFAELCTCVIMYKTGHGNWNGDDFEARDSTVLHRARATGQCLQLVNIARDIVADSHEGRCYVPLKFMQDQSIYTTLKTRRPDVVDSKVLKGYAIKILGLADSLVPQGHLGINGLPFEVRDGVRAAFEIYLAIGPALREAENFPIRAKVPKSRQKMIAFSCIYGLYGLRAKSMGAIRSLIHPFGPSYYQKPSASF
ncbi:hypothetical protein LRAMOSA00494 [Lichtheimia ramosa]|uniref:15-cis-phytoene synthase n=1 Tax=Lichtheimia ramosa TaxID=688394 RepID=A0A077W6Q5_9FUNG|nr:hypothetical protein LRAMOSA00494 [Lichtheimia ramosa]